MNKEQLLENSNRGLDYYLLVFNHYNIPLKRKGKFKFENTLNPFYNDTSKGFSIYFNKKKNIWCFKDFGTDEWGNEYGGDVFNFFAVYHGKDVNQDFVEILSLMEFELESYPRGYIEQFDNNFIVPREEMYTKYRLLTVETPSQAFLEYCKPYGGDLSKYQNVHQIKGYEILLNDKVVETKIYKNFDTDIRIAYDNGIRCKIKRINPKHYRMIGDSSVPYYFGNIEYADYLDEPYFLVEGEKDATTLWNLGFNSGCLQSGTANLPKKHGKELYHSRYKVIVLYDTDATGKKGAEKLKGEWNYEVADLSSIIPNNLKDKVKDISDYVFHALDQKKLLDFLNSFQPEKKIKVEDGIVIENERVDNQNLEDLKILEDLDNDVKTINEQNNYKALDDDIFLRLPDLLQQICYPMTEKHERDLLLFSSLGVLSNIVPVYGHYDNRTVYPNLFVFITALPSAGKGSLKWVKKIAQKIHRIKGKAYDVEMQEYNSLENEEKRSTKKPIKQTFFIPGNSSVSAIINQLHKNNGIGVIIESEADALNTAMKSDWGNYSEVLRKAFEFETISMLRKDEENSFEIDDPKLSVVITGTPNQLLEFIPSPENGLFSRFIFIELPLIKKWKNVHDNTINFDKYYDKIADELLEFYIKLNNNRIRIELSKTQKKKFNDKFRTYQKQYDTLFGEEIIASIRRIGSIHFRICLLLTGIRNMNSLGDFKANDVVECSDEDFEIANILIEYILRNLKDIYGYLPQTKKIIKNLKRKEALLYEALDNEFSFDTYKKTSKNLNIAESTAYGYLKRFIKNDLVERFEHGIYRKL